MQYSPKTQFPPATAACLLGCKMPGITQPTSCEAFCSSPCHPGLSVPVCMCVCTWRRLLMHCELCSKSAVGLYPITYLAGWSSIHKVTTRHHAFICSSFKKQPNNSIGVLWNIPLCASTFHFALPCLIKAICCHLQEPRWRCTALVLHTEGWNPRLGTLWYSSLPPAYRYTKTNRKKPSGDR